MPTTKVAIRARVRELDEQLHRHKATLVQQQDERQQLVQDCAQHGGHDFEGPFGGSVDFCMFCGLVKNASREQIARNLVRMG